MAICNFEDRLCRLLRLFSLLYLVSGVSHTAQRVSLLSLKHSAVPCLQPVMDKHVRKAERGRYRQFLEVKTFVFLDKGNVAGAESF